MHPRHSPGTFEQNFTELDLDGSVPDLAPATDGRQGRTYVIAALVAREKISTLRQLIGRMSLGRAHHVVIGTPEQVADDIEQWFEGRAADGFNLMPATLPAGLDDFVEQAVPDLQRRGLFRSEFTTGTTLRDHYGLMRPQAHSARPVGRRRRSNDCACTAWVDSGTVAPARQAFPSPSVALDQFGIPQEAKHAPTHAR